MAEHLSHLLRKQRSDALLRQAEAIRDYPDCEERIQEAETHVREAMLQRALGNLSDAERYRIFSILSFVMPSDAPGENEPPPSWP